MDVDVWGPLLRLRYDDTSALRRSQKLESGFPVYFITWPSFAQTLLALVLSSCPLALVRFLASCSAAFLLLCSRVWLCCSLAPSAPLRSCALALLRSLVQRTGRLKRASSTR